METHDSGPSAAQTSRTASDSSDVAEPAPTSRLASRDSTNADYISYMADMVQEMRVLAERTGCPTLAGILQLAHSEALREAGRR